MTNRILIAALTLFAVTQSASAWTDNRDAESNRVVVECHGYLGKLSLYLASSWPQEDVSKAVTSLELGMVVKTWAPQQNFVYDEASNDQGADVSVEASLGEGLGVSSYKVPNWGNMSVDTAQKRFSTGLTLKTAIYKGNASMNCAMSLKKIKSAEQVKVNY